jgi:hypothetical protein
MAAIIKVFLRSSARSDWQQRVENRKTNDEIERLQALQRAKQAEREAKEEFSKYILNCVRTRIHQTTGATFRCSRALPAMLHRKDKEICDETAKEIRNELIRGDFAAGDKNVKCSIRCDSYNVDCACDVALE